MDEDLLGIIMTIIIVIGCCVVLPIMIVWITNKRRFLLALCEGDRMEAKDIAQEAMVKAYIAIERFMERAKFSTWLLNTTVEMHRYPPRESNAIKKLLPGTECRAKVFFVEHFLGS